MEQDKPTSKFRYLLDPLFLACVGLYFLNRLVIKPNCDIHFFHAWLNDLICIPFWVPIMLAGMRLFRLRRHDNPPTVAEIGIPLILWSWWFEIYLPNLATLEHRHYADPWDIVAYSIGAIFAWFFWNRQMFLPEWIRTGSRSTNPC
jgi:hypothetical protein